MKAYLDAVAGSRFVPADKSDFRVMVQTFLLEKSLNDLNHALSNNLGSIVVPMRTIKIIIK
jgi:maltose alpha-D-glucosyltransferase/alpha-amylase